MALRWSYALFSLSSSLPHSTPKTSPLPLVTSTIGAANKQYDLDDSKSKFSNKHNRNLSGSVHNTTSQSIKNDAHYLRAKPAPITPSERQPSHLNQSAPLTSLIYPLHAKSGTHHAYMYIGTPPQRQTLIVDTGSRLTAFPCHPHCPNCGTHTSKPFHLNESSSHDILSCDSCKFSQVDFPLEEYFVGDGIGGNSGDGPSLRGTNNNNKQMNNQRQRNLFPDSCINNQCGIDQRYTEGSSWKAFEVQDKVWLGFDEMTLSVEEHGKYSTPFVFGCQVSEQGLFKTQYADGIMGLSMYTQTLVGTWLEQKSISHQSFSLCLNRKGGHISLGGTGLTHDPSPREEQHHANAGKHLAPMQFTPFAREDVWYYTVTVTSISVGTHVLPKSILQFVNDDRKGTIVDSGTTDTFITHKVAKPFMFAWEKITGKRYNNRIQTYTYEQFNELPVITFELHGGVQWEITPEAYMEASGDSGQIVNENVKNDSKSQWIGKRGFISRVYVDEPQGVVLGSNAMMDKEIYFDIANRRLGVAKATCAY